MTNPIASIGFLIPIRIYEVKDVTNNRFKHRVDILIHPKDSKKILLKNVKIKIL